MAHIQNSPTQWKLSKPFLLASLGFLVLIIGLWLPFGFQANGLLEEWSYYAAFDWGEPVIGPIILNTTPNRPFALFGLAFGYYISPKSFVGLHILYMAMMFGKCISIYLILRRLGVVSPVLAFTIAVLFVVYPADISLFSFRANGYHLAILLFLIAFYWFIVYWQTGRTIVLFAVWITTFFTAGMGETIYPLAVCAPFLLLLFKKGDLRRWRIATIVWFSAALPFFILTFFVLTSGQTNYQRELMNRASSQLNPLLAYTYFMARAYYRNLIEGWTDLLKFDGARSSILIFVILITLILSGINWLITKVSSKLEKYQFMPSFLVIGLIIIGLGFAPFLPVPHRTTNEYVFLVSSLGAAIVIGMTAFLISRFMPFPTTSHLAITGLFIGLAFWGGLRQQQTMLEYSNQQKKILDVIVKTVPQLDDDTLILLFDPTHALQKNQWLFGATGSSLVFTNAIQHIYHRQQSQAFLCYPDLGVWGGYQESCEIREDGITIKFGSQEIASTPNTRIVAFQYAPSGDLTLVQQPYLAE